MKQRPKISTIFPLYTRQLQCDCRSIRELTFSRSDKQLGKVVSQSLKLPPTFPLDYSTTTKMAFPPQRLGFPVVLEPRRDYVSSCSISLGNGIVFSWFQNKKVGTSRTSTQGSWDRQRENTSAGVVDPFMWALMTEQNCLYLDFDRESDQKWSSWGGEALE